MKRKNRMLSTVLVAGALAVASAGVIFATSTSGNQYYDAQTESPVINLGAEKNRLFASGASASGTSSVLTGLNNKIGVTYSDFAVALPEGGWHTINAGGYFENSDQILGLHTLSFTLALDEAATASVKVEWSRTAGTYASSDSEVFTVTGSTLTTVDFDGRNPSYFRLSNAGESAITITSATVNFSCTSSNLPIMTADDYAELLAPYKESVTNATLAISNKSVSDTQTSSYSETAKFDGTKAHDVVYNGTTLSDGTTHASTHDMIFDGEGYLYTADSEGVYTRTTYSGSLPMNFNNAFNNSLLFGEEVISIFEKDGDVYNSTAPYYRTQANGEVTYSLTSSDTADEIINEAHIYINEDGALIASKCSLTRIEGGEKVESDLAVSDLGTTTVTIPTNFVLPGEGDWNKATKALDDMTIGMIRKSVTKHSPAGDGTMSSEALVSESLEVNGTVAQESDDTGSTYYRTVSGEVQAKTAASTGETSAWAKVDSLPTLKEVLTTYGLIGDTPVLSFSDIVFNNSYTIEASKAVSLDTNYDFSSGSTHYIKNVAISLDATAGVFWGIQIDVFDPQSYTGDGTPDGSDVTEYSYYSIAYNFSYTSELSESSFPKSTDEIWEAHVATIDGLVSGKIEESVFVNTPVTTETETGTETTYNTTRQIYYVLEANAGVATEKTTTITWDAETQAENSTTVSSAYKTENGQAMRYDAETGTWGETTAVPTLNGYLTDSLALTTWLKASDLAYSVNSSTDGSYSLTNDSLTVALDANYNIAVGTTHKVTGVFIEVISDVIRAISIELAGTGEDTNTYSVSYALTYESKLTADYLPGVQRVAATEWAAALDTIDTVRGGVGGFGFDYYDLAYASQGATQYDSYAHVSGTRSFNGGYSSLSAYDGDTYAQTDDSYYRSVNGVSYVYDGLATESTWAVSDIFPDASGLLLGSLYSMLKVDSFVYECDGATSTFTYDITEPDAWSYDVDENGNIVDGSALACYTITITLSYGELASIYVQLGDEGHVISGTTSIYQITYNNFSSTSDLDDTLYPFSAFSAE